MRTFLLTWNPNYWPWESLAEDSARVRAQGYFDGGWSTGSRRDMDEGDRIYLLRQGVEPRGILASGHVTSRPYEETHWAPEKKRGGRTAWAVHVRWDVILAAPALSTAELDTPPLDGFNWHPRSSGVQIPANVAALLDEVWRSRVSEGPGTAGERLGFEL